MTAKSIVADILIYSMLTLMALVTFIPIWHVFNTSISSPVAVLQTPVMLWPQQLTLDSYQFIFKNPALLRSVGITVYITMVGTFLNLVFTTTAAYVLSKRWLPGNSFFLMMIVVTMVFHAGLIPGYILVRNLGLIDSVWSMILPPMINAFNLLLMRNFFWGIPEELSESAKMDGAGEMRVLWSIMLPLSLPAIATIGLLYGVSHWNEFFRGIFYINDSAKWPLQVFLRTVISQADLNEFGVNNQTMYVTNKINVLTIQSATIIAATVPIMAVYPFLQKYFVKGMLLGSIKG